MVTETLVKELHLPDPPPEDVQLKDTLDVTLVDFVRTKLPPLALTAPVAGLIVKAVAATPLAIVLRFGPTITGELFVALPAKAGEVNAPSIKPNEIRQTFISPPLTESGRCPFDRQSPRWGYDRGQRSDVCDGNRDGGDSGAGDEVGCEHGASRW